MERREGESAEAYLVRMRAAYAVAVEEMTRAYMALGVAVAHVAHARGEDVRAAADATHAERERVVERILCAWEG